MTSKNPLETDLEHLDFCPFMKQCNPDNDDIENYCFLNYNSCSRYLEKVNDI